MSACSKPFAILALAVAIGCWVAAPRAATAENPGLPGSVANAPSPVSSHGGNPTAAAAGSPTGKTTERLREGTKLVDIVGTFQSVGGDSVTFIPGPSGSNKEPLRVLENLALQRVGQVLDENKGARLWTVSGEITEYKGTNYLLLKKTVIHPQEGDAVAGH